MVGVYLLFVDNVYTQIHIHMYVCIGVYLSVNMFIL